MAQRLDYSKHRYVGSVMNTQHYQNPKSGFDKAWHDHQRSRKDYFLNTDLGTHEQHDIEVIKLDTGPHAGKLHCTTCNKFIKWIPKKYL